MLSDVVVVYWDFDEGLMWMVLDFDVEDVVFVQGETWMTH